MTAFTDFSALDSVVVSILDSSNVFNSCVFDANALLPPFVPKRRNSCCQVVSHLSLTALLLEMHWMTRWY